MSNRSSFPLRTALTVLGLALPVAAVGGQPAGTPDGESFSLVRSWTLRGCGTGVVVARPEVVVDDVVCVSGLARWGQSVLEPFWILQLDLVPTGHPDLALGPFLDENNSFLSFLYRADRAGCEEGCDGSLPLSEGQPGLLVSGEGMEPNSFALTGVSLTYLYLPRGGEDRDWGVTVTLTPTLVPEPSTFALTGGALVLVGLGIVRRRRRSRGRA